MKIQTKFLGEMDILEDSILTFPEGIPGFPEEKKFVLVPLNEASPFLTLQSVTTEALGFMVATPYAFNPSYSFDLQQEDIEQLKVEQPTDVFVYGILTLKDKLDNSTINLLAPIVINDKEKMAKQIVLTDENEAMLRYPLKKVSEGSAK